MMTTAAKSSAVGGGKSPFRKDSWLTYTAIVAGFSLLLNILENLLSEYYMIFAVVGLLAYVCVELTMRARKLGRIAKADIGEFKVSLQAAAKAGDAERAETL